MSTFSARIKSEGRIPVKYLRGERVRYRSVHNVYKNVLMHEVLKSIYRSYKERSEMNEPPSLRHRSNEWRGIYGNDDELGNRWVQLKPITYTKWKKDENGSHDKWKSYLTNKRSEAARETGRMVQGLDYIHDGINIRTGRLLASYYPGPIVNGRLIATKDQSISETQTGIRFRTEVEYSESIENSLRPIIPNNGSMDFWIEEGHRIALDHAEREYIRIKAKEDAINVRRRAKRKFK